MKIRDSGMPDVGMWEGFFDAPRILDQLGCTDTPADIAEFGCGYGTFTVAAAARTAGALHAFDIDPAMVAATRERVRAAGLRNVVVTERDFIATGTGLADASAGVALLREAWRVLQPGGRVHVIHWICDRPTPRGPALAIRPRPEQCRAWLAAAGFRVLPAVIDLPPWHYGISAERPTGPHPRQVGETR